jgi:hypothetical protein
MYLSGVHIFSERFTTYFVYHIVVSFSLLYMQVSCCEANHIPYTLAYIVFPCILLNIPHDKQVLK